LLLSSQLADSHSARQYFAVTIGQQIQRGKEDADERYVGQIMSYCRSLVQRAHATAFQRSNLCEITLYEFCEPWRLFLGVSFCVPELSLLLLHPLAAHSNSRSGVSPRASRANTPLEKSRCSNGAVDAILVPALVAVQSAALCGVNGFRAWGWSDTVVAADPHFPPCLQTS